MMDSNPIKPKSFNERFEGCSRVLPDDCVEYTISVIDTTLDTQGLREKLRGVQGFATSYTKKLLEGYIWQRDSFHLDFLQEKGSVFLYGRTNYGDSVEDEWLVVYILRELSRVHPDVWVRVIDTDGQFLLIEAAATLPKWLNPEIADFRVWINSGRLLIIPNELQDCRNLKGRPTPQKLTLEDALAFVKERRTSMLHSPLIEAEAFYRLEKYPQQIRNSLHHASISIPRKLAYLIHQNESYISPAIEAFYLRDPIALRPLHTSVENLQFPPTDLVTVSVKFTKVGYAQLRSQQFTIPPTWSKLIGKDMIGRRSEIGMKLTSGFEMLVSDPQHEDKRQVREITLLLEDVQTGQDKLPTDLEIQKWPKIQDDESWLDVNFEAFEKELAGKGEKSKQGSFSGFGDKSAQENLRKMVARFEDFLNDDTAGAEGAEYSDDMDNDDDDSSENEVGSEDVSLDEEQFTTMMKEMMGMSTSEAEGAKHSNLPAWTRKAEDQDRSCLTGYPPESIPKEMLIRPAAGSHLGQRIKELELDPGSDSDEGAEIQYTMQGMERELRSAGALRLNPEFSTKKANNDDNNKDISASTQRLEHNPAAGFTSGESVNEEIDIDLNLAKNMLESFKGQGGLAGPGGNLLGLMGVRIPRDED